MKNHRCGLFGDFFFQSIHDAPNRHKTDITFLANLSNREAAGVDRQAGEFLGQRGFLGGSDRMMISNDQLPNVNSFARSQGALHGKAIDVRIADFIRQHDIARLGVGRER